MTGYCRYFAFLIAVFVLGITSVHANAQTQHETWGSSGPWAIRIDPDGGGSCYMENTLEDGTLVQFGIAPNRNGGFFAAYNAKWTNLDEGYRGNLLFDFGPSLFGGEFVGAVLRGLPGGYAFFNNPDFVKEFGKRNEVSIREENGGALSFKLTGTMKAINAVRTCDAERQQ